MSDTTVTITSETLEYMADRIEELEAELSEQIEWVKSLADDLIAAEGREARLKEKLEKALDFLEDLTECEWPYDEGAKCILAELTGGKDAE